jgi:hypothetical protein
MSSKISIRSARRVLVGSVVAAAFAATSTGCAEIEVPLAEPYEPAAVESAGPNQPAKIILTEEGMRRIALQTTVVRPQGQGLTVDYAALVFDKKGMPWVFKVTGPRTYVREAVKIKEVKDDQVLMSAGPPAGTEVVTVGAIELWGAELGIAGKH